jgi:hypothetical protein
MRNSVAKRLRKSVTNPQTVAYADRTDVIVSRVTMIPNLLIEDDKERMEPENLIKGVQSFKSKSPLVMAPCGRKEYKKLKKSV